MSAADGAEMSDSLARRGFSRAEAPDDADAVLISTCTVRDHAEHRALSLIGALRPWKEADPRRVLIVAGCAAQRLEDGLQKRFPFVDLVIGAKSIERFDELVAGAIGERFDAVEESREAFEGWSPTGSTATAFVTVMRGCNYSCSYCVVPAVRGRELYRPVDAVLADVEAKVAAGAREVMLLGQTVNSYRSGGVDFAGLLRLVDRMPGLLRTRFMSPHPYYADEAMLAAMAECRTVCPQLHLPAQSGSDRILKLMRRNYTASRLLELATAARRRIAGVVLSTDIIVGFPTETGDDFERTLSLVETMSPASAFCFKYSAREGTAAAELADDVLRDVKESRLARLNAVVDRLTDAAQGAQVGKTVEVLGEQARFGRTPQGFKVRWDRDIPVGSTAMVRVTGAARRTLLGEIR